MGSLFCDCEKRNQNLQDQTPISNEQNVKIKPLSSIPSKLISKQSSSIVTLPRTNIEEHISIDKTTLIGKGEGDIRDTYEIGRKIGGGSFGLVFLSINKRTGEKVAIKAMRKYKNDNKTVNNYLLKEVEMLKTLDHQNILNIYEFYEGTYNFYIVTEYCQSGNLLDKITKGNYLMSESRAAVILFQILSAINYCHQRKIIHRDLKPENIMIDNTSKNGYPYIKIIDFGTAKFIGEQYENQLIGSPYYMAPEVFEKKYTDKCDIWSIGIVLYFIISKRKPFNGDSFEDIFKCIKENEPDLQSKPFDKASHELIDLIKKMLDKDQNKRISADEALKHEWFIKNKTKEKLTELTYKDINDLLENIKTYNPKNILQQTTLIYLVNSNSNASTVKKSSSLYIKLDQDNNGIIDKKEFINGLKVLFNEKMEKVDEEFLEDCFNKIDTNNSGKIEYEEFITAAINKKEFLTVTLMKQAFEHFDIDKTGKITVENIAKIFGFYENENILNELHNVIKECDVDNEKGYFELNDFIHIMKKIFKMK